MTTKQIREHKAGNQRRKREAQQYVNMFRKGTAKRASAVLASRPLIQSGRKP